MTSSDDPACFDNEDDPTRAFLNRAERSDGRRCYCPIGLCPAGYICYEGTKEEEKNRNLCLEGYYCPEVTWALTGIACGFASCSALSTKPAAISPQKAAAV